MKELKNWIVGRLSTRECRGCDDESFHTAHLTRFGHWRLGLRKK